MDSTPLPIRSFSHTIVDAEDTICVQDDVTFTVPVETGRTLSALPVKFDDKDNASQFVMDEP